MCAREGRSLRPACGMSTVLPSLSAGSQTCQVLEPSASQVKVSATWVQYAGHVRQSASPTHATYLAVQVKRGALLPGRIGVVTQCPQVVYVLAKRVSWGLDYPAMLSSLVPGVLTGLICLCASFATVTLSVGTLRASAGTGATLSAVTSGGLVRIRVR